MGRRLLQLIGVAAVVVPVAVLLRLATVPVAGQTPSASAQSGAGAQSDPAPTTPWGEPDLQGIWTNDYQIPLQRPAQYAGKGMCCNFEKQQETDLVESTGRPYQATTSNSLSMN